jgi:hypothetical protein
MGGWCCFSFAVSISRPYVPCGQRLWRGDLYRFAVVVVVVVLVGEKEEGGIDATYENL